MVAHAPVDRGHGVVLDQRLPSFAVAPRGDVREPGLDVLSRRARVVAGREQVLVDRPLSTKRTRSPLMGKVGRLGQIGWVLFHGPTLVLTRGSAGNYDGRQGSNQIERIARIPGVAIWCYTGVSHLWPSVLIGGSLGNRQVEKRSDETADGHRLPQIAFGIVLRGRLRSRQCVTVAPLAPPHPQPCGPGLA